jgi:hypothetical protein
MKFGFAIAAVFLTGLGVATAQTPEFTPDQRQEADALGSILN